MKKAFPDKFEIKGKQESELMVEIVDILAKSQGFNVNKEKVAFAIASGSNSNPRIAGWIQTASRILDTVEEVLNK